MGEQEPRPQALPIISEQTRNKILEELGLDMDQKTKDIISSITYEKKPPVYNLRQEMAERVFSGLVTVNRPLVQALQEAIKDDLYFRHEAPYRSECAAGIAVVIRAFDIESEHDLIGNFQNIDAGDIARIKEIFRESLWSEKMQDLLERILRIPRIPEQQINLNSIIDKTASSLGIEEPLRSGAGIMYKILSEFRSKLFPRGTTSQQ